MIIKTKDDYIDFLRADRISLGLDKESPQIVPRNERQVVWRFQRLLRKVEYLTNAKSNFVQKIELKLLKQLYFRQQLKLGFQIPVNVFGPGLSIAHVGPIIVNSSAKVGANCRIHIGTNIGMSGRNKQAAKLGDNVYIGIGSKIIGDIYIADGVVIGANAVVAKSINEASVTVGGIPAKVISLNGNPLPDERRGYKKDA